MDLGADRGAHVRRAFEGARYPGSTFAERYLYREGVGAYARADLFCQIVADFRSFSAVLAPIFASKYAFNFFSILKIY